MRPAYEFDDVRVEPDAFRVLKVGQPVALEPKAIDLLTYLVENPGRLVEKQELLDAVWKDTAVSEGAMTRVIAQLRKALGDAAAEPRYLETVPTRGYRFIADVRRVPAAERAPTGVVRFGTFELDRSTGELRRAGGQRVPLQDQPAQVLALFVSRPGDVVTRDELRRALWSEDTFVEFDTAVNVAINKIRQALGDSATSPRFVETVPKRGYRFLAEVHPVEPRVPTQTVESRAPETTLPTSTGRGRTMWLVAALAAAALLASFAAVLRRSDPSDHARIRSLAVLPLANLTGDPAQEYFSDGMTDVLITNLASLPALRVISRQSVMRYKGSAKPLPEIARELGVEGVIEGSVVRSGGRVRISAQLVHASTERHLWAHSYERPMEDVLALQGELARAIAEAVRVTVGTKENRRLMSSARVVKPEAYDAYLLGRHQWDQRTRTEESLDRALAYFQAAIAADPDFAAAHVGLALVQGPRQVYGYVPPGTGLAEQKASALRALELDPGLAEARAALGGARTIEWDWDGADAEFRRALELDPNSMVTHVWYGWHLQARGRVAEGADHTRRALELDPLNIVASHGVARNLADAGDDEAALAQWNRTLEVDPDLATTHRGMALFYFERGNHDAGSRHLERARVLQSEGPVAQASLAVLDAASGNGRQARQVLEELEAESARRYVSPVLPAMIHVALGENDRAFPLLDRACAAKDAALVSIQVGYIGNLLQLPRARLAALRADPRFDDLRRRMGVSGEPPAK